MLGLLAASALVLAHGALANGACSCARYFEA